MARFHDPVLVMHTETLKARERKIAAAALVSACVLSVIRAFLVPFLIHIAPKNTFPGMDADAVQVTSLCCAGLFALLALWATKDPIWPAIGALVFYACISYPDLVNQQGFLAKGLISKVVTTCILLRALAAGLVHSTSSASLPTQ